jgi:sulfur-carrier protein adenylyltransferase/sulfurtransferase
MAHDNYEMYSRQIRLQEVGIEGQKKLKEAKVLIVGVGALGSPNALYLASAGVGTIGLVDGDRLEVSNLHRQVIYSMNEINELKTKSASNRLKSINPNLIINEHNEYLTSKNALGIIDGYDIVINGSDNFPTRYLVNDSCVLLKKPLVDASILRFKGQATVFYPGKGCYRCLFPAPPPPNAVPSCAEAGVLGAIAGHIGSLQAIETLKLILQTGSNMIGKLLTYDALNGRYTSLKYSRNKNCPICGDTPTIKELIDYNAFCGISKDNSLLNKSQDSLIQKGWAIEPHKIEEKLKINKNIFILDVRTPEEFNVFHLKGTTLLPLADVEKKIPILKQHEEVYVLCKSGERSAEATNLLRANGIKSFNIHGGLLKWRFEFNK